MLYLIMHIEIIFRLLRKEKLSQKVKSRRSWEGEIFAHRNLRGQEEEPHMQEWKSVHTLKHQSSRTVGWVTVVSFQLNFPKSHHNWECWQTQAKEWEKNQPFQPAMCDMIKVKKSETGIWHDVGNTTWWMIKLCNAIEHRRDSAWNPRGWSGQCLFHRAEGVCVGVLRASSRAIFIYAHLAYGVLSFGFHTITLLRNLFCIVFRPFLTH